MAGQVALLLETHMVFSSGAEAAANEEEAPNQEVSRWISLYCYKHLHQEVAPEAEEELYSGLRTQDLQEAKDQLLVINLILSYHPRQLHHGQRAASW